MSSLPESEKSEDESSKKCIKLSYKHSRYDKPLSKEDHLTEEFRQFNEEWGKSGGFDADLSKLSYTFGSGSVDLDDDDLVKEPETNRDLLNRLSNLAISYYKDKTGTSLEFVDVLRANYHPSAYITFYITFRANDPSDGTQAKLFRAMVLYLIDFTGEVYSCDPRPC